MVCITEPNSAALSRFFEIDSVPIWFIAGEDGICGATAFVRVCRLGAPSEFGANLFDAGDGIP